ncbi:MAG: MMPL family transporter [Treponema sp.]|nr:MMPL family transporter [Treponema sp.]
MSVEHFNSFFRQFGEFQIKHRAFFLAFIAVFTLGGFLGLTKFQGDNSEDGWFDKTEEVKRNQDYFESIFGSDDAIMILVESDDVFSPTVLKAIECLSDRLVSEVPYADEVTSLMNLSISHGTEDGFEVINPFEDGVPDISTEEGKNSLAAKKELILSRRSLVNNLVSDDSKETWVLLSLNPYESEEQSAIGKVAYDIVHSPEFKSDVYTMKGTGIAYTEYEEDVVTGEECAKRIGIGFCVMILCLLIFVRSLRGLIVPIFATVGGIVAVLGYSSLFGIKSNLTMLALPVLLGMALSVGYSIHYINEFRLHFRTSGKRRESVVKAVEETGWPILFTVITTMASMISFMTVGIGELKWVGGICASIVFATYLYVIILIPVFMSYGKNKEGKVSPSLQPASQSYATPSAGDTPATPPYPQNATHADRFFENFGASVVKKRWLIVGISAAIIIACVPGCFKLGVNMDYMEMMGKKIPYVKELLTILDAKLGSQYCYNVMVEFDEADAFKIPENMKKLDALEEKISRFKLTRWSGNEPRITGVTDIVKEVNCTLNEDNGEFYKIPDNQDLLTQELFLYEMSGGDNLSKWLDAEYKTTFLHVDLNGYDANQIVEDIKNAKAAAQNLFPDAKVGVVGQVVNYAAMNEKLVKGELKSFMFSFVIIAVLMILAFSSITTGLIGMIPNLAPVLCIGAFMGWGKISLDMLTMTVMPMILGIAVDDTIHFTNRTKLEFERTGSYLESIKITFREIGKTLGMTTFILCSMFAVFCTSPMNALARIGLLTILGLGSALIADYTLTPVLIYITKPFGREQKKEETV